MTCARVPNFCLPNIGGDTFSDDNFGSYDDYFNNDDCASKKCAQQKVQRIQDTDAGFNMRERLSKLSTCCTAKPGANCKSPDAAPVEPPPPPPPPETDCCRNQCHHRTPKTNRKFICNFAPSTADCISQCLEMERSRCAAFWKLIDIRPEFQSLMRFGEFEQTNLPQIVEPRKPKDISITCQNADELRAKNKALHDEDRERAEKRKKAMDELQKKSGQPVRETKIKPNKLAELLVEPVMMDFAKIVEEMNAFDKMVKNPVRTIMNPPSATSIEWIHPDRRRLSGSGRRELSNPLIIPEEEEGESSEEEEMLWNDMGREGAEEENQNAKLRKSGEGRESLGSTAKHRTSLK